MMKLKHESDRPISQRRQLRRRFGRSSACPAIRTDPRVGLSSAPSRCSSVLLPAPLAPTIATISPRSTSQVDAVEHGDRAAVTADVHLRQVDRLQHRHS